MDAETGHWLAITQDGRHFVLDPMALPRDGALREFVSRLDAGAVAGWLATSEKAPDSDGDFELDLICKLTECEGDWHAAAAAFKRLRRAHRSGPSDRTMLLGSRPNCQGTGLH